MHADRVLPGGGNPLTVVTMQNDRLHATAKILVNGFDSESFTADRHFFNKGCSIYSVG